MHLNGPMERSRRRTSARRGSPDRTLMVHEAEAVERLGIPAHARRNECLSGVGRAVVATVLVGGRQPIPGGSADECVTGRFEIAGDMAPAALRQ